MTTPEARDAFDDWAAALVESVESGAITGDAHVAMLVAALRTDPTRDRRSVWLAFSAGWVSAMTHVKELAADAGARPYSDDAGARPRKHRRAAPRISTASTSADDVDG